MDFDVDIGANGNPAFGHREPHPTSRTIRPAERLGQGLGASNTQAPARAAGAGQFRPGKFIRGSSAPIEFSEVGVELTGHKVFDPGRESYHSEYPFWRLHNDGVWTIERADRLEKRESSTDAKKSELLKHNTHGGFTTGILQTLHETPNL